MLLPATLFFLNAYANYRRKWPIQHMLLQNGVVYSLLLKYFVDSPQHGFIYPQYGWEGRLTCGVAVSVEGLCLRDLHLSLWEVRLTSTKSPTDTSETWNCVVNYKKRDHIVAPCPSDSATLTV